MTNDTDDINSFSRLSCPSDGLFCEVPVRGFWPLKKNRVSAFFLFLSRCSLYILLFHSLKGPWIARGSLILMESKGKALNVELKRLLWVMFFTLDKSQTPASEGSEIPVLRERKRILPPSSFPPAAPRPGSIPPLLRPEQSTILPCYDVLLIKSPFSFSSFMLNFLFVQPNDPHFTEVKCYGFLQVPGYLV